MSNRQGVAQGKELGSLVTSEIEQQKAWKVGAQADSGSVEASLEALQCALAVGSIATAQARFIAAVERALLQESAAPQQDAHWHRHALALACDRAGEALLAHGLLEPGVDVLRLGLRIRERLAHMTVADDLFRATVEVPIELAASHFAIAHAYQRGGQPAAALAEMQAGIAAYRREVEMSDDPNALDTLAAHLEDAGRIARDVPDREAMRALIADSLGLRERAVQLAPEDPDLARAFIEACVWRTPDIGKASAMWLDRARRLLADREAGAHPIPGTPRLRNLVDTAGAPYLSS
jgi:tetratricopeptide (TPR) repeat protein